MKQYIWLRLFYMKFLIKLVNILTIILCNIFLNIVDLKLLV